MTTCVPRINRLDVDSMSTSVHVTGLFTRTWPSAARQDGGYQILPLSYAGFARRIVENLEFDLTVAKLSPPNQHDTCSLGPSAEFTLRAIDKSRRVLGLLNRRTPHFGNHSPTIALRDLDYVCEADTPLATDTSPCHLASETIATSVSAFVVDGLTLQFGPGTFPNAMAMHLRDQRQLRLHSGLLSDNIVKLLKQVRWPPILAI